MADILVSQCGADRYALALRLVLGEYRRRTPAMPITSLPGLGNPLDGSQLTPFDVPFGADNPGAFAANVPGDTGLGSNVDWNLLGDPTFDPGFTWQIANPAGLGTGMTGSLQPVSAFL